VSGIDGELRVVEADSSARSLPKGRRARTQRRRHCRGCSALEQFVQGGGVIVSGRSACAGNFGYGVLAGGCFTTGQELRSQLPPHVTR